MWCGLYCALFWIQGKTCNRYWHTRNNEAQKQGKIVEAQIWCEVK